MKIRIFTDGACSENPGPGGWAAVFNSEDKCKMIKGNESTTTNNRMELKAVIESFRMILSRFKTRKDIEFELYSDSAYVVNSINNGWVEKWQKNNWKTTKDEDVKNRDLWEQFVALHKTIKVVGIDVKIIKIKGHTGNTFNELVDKIAKEESMKAKESACRD
jgi:ribonuclease HI